MFSNEMFPNEMKKPVADPNEMSPNEMHPNEMYPNEMNPNEMCANEMDDIEFWKRLDREEGENVLYNQRNEAVTYCKEYVKSHEFVAKSSRIV